MERGVNPQALLLLALCLICWWCYPGTIMSAENLTAKHLFLLGKLRCNSGDFKKAVDYFNKALAKNPKYFAAYFARGCVWFRKGDFDRAISDFDKALETERRYPAVYTVRGKSWACKGDYARAISDFNKVLNVGGGWKLASISEDYKIENYLARGNAFYKKGSHDLATADYNCALKINPKYASGYNNLAWFLATCPDARFRDGVKAIELAQKAIELQEELPEDPYLMAIFLNTLAASYAEAGKFKAAITTQKIAIEMFKKEGITERLSDEFEKHLKCYMIHEPWRE